MSYEDEPIRRVSSVDLILPLKESLAIQVLAARQNSDNSINYLGEKDLQQALASKGLLEKCPLGEEIETRTLFLKHLLETGNSSRQELRQAVAEYYQSRSK